MTYQKNKPVHLNTVVLDHFQTVFFWQNLKTNKLKKNSTTTGQSMEYQNDMYHIMTIINNTM